MAQDRPHAQERLQVQEHTQGLHQVVAQLHLARRLVAQGHWARHEGFAEGSQLLATLQGLLDQSCVVLRRCVGLHSTQHCVCFSESVAKVATHYDERLSSGRLHYAHRDLRSIGHANCMRRLLWELEK